MQALEVIRELQKHFPIKRSPMRVGLTVPEQNISSLMEKLDAWDASIVSKDNSGSQLSLVSVFLLLKYIPLPLTMSPLMWCFFFLNKLSICEGSNENVLVWIHSQWFWFIIRTHWTSDVVRNQISGYSMLVCYSFYVYDFCYQWISTVAKFIALS